jgi:S1-C subfamily serine protease
VVPGSPAAESLEAGDVILEVNGTRVANAREAAARMRETAPDRPSLVRVQRDGRAIFAALERRK